MEWIMVRNSCFSRGFDLRFSKCFIKVVFSRQLHRQALHQPASKQRVSSGHSAALDGYARRAKSLLLRARKMVLDSSQNNLYGSKEILGIPLESIPHSYFLKQNYLFSSCNVKKWSKVLDKIFLLKILHS